MGMRVIYLILGGLFFFTVSAYAQSSVQQELSRRNLTLSQAQELARQAGINPNDPDQIARVARARGVSEEQIQEWLIDLRLNNRGDTSGTGLEDLSGNITSADDIILSGSADQDSVPNTTSSKDTSGLEYFGYNIFSDTPDPFKPRTVGPVGDGYVVGPEDQLRLTVWGATEFQYELQVDVEGRILIPNIGMVTVAGQRLSNLRESLKVRLGKSYSGLLKDPPTIFIDLTVTRLRPIQLFVLGEVKNPGGYSFTHNSTIFNVLYGVGGPKISGSLRDVRVIREGKQIASIDLYELLLNGTDNQNIPLLNNDRIFIPPRESTVSVQGQIRRPAIYEMKPDEGLSQLIEFAGGVKSEAYGDRFQISRVIPIEQREDPSFARQIIDYPLKEVLSGEREVKLFDQDKVRMFKISEVSDDYVQITGLVNQPGIYELSEKIRTIRDLILAADSLRDDAFLGRAILTRTNDDSTTTVFSVDLQALIENEGLSQNITLQKRDQLQVFRNTVELIDQRYVNITGEVSNPGRYKYSENMSLEDLILKAGGFTEAAYIGDSEITRSEKTPSKNMLTSKLTHELTSDSEKKDDFYSVEHFWPILDNAKTFDLQHRDQVYIRRNPRFNEQRFISIEGEVEFPGTYTILSENERLSTVIERAGGLTREAYAAGARLFRGDREVIINLRELLQGDRTQEIFVKSGDSIRVPQIPNTVLVSGNVALDGYIKFKDGERLTYYLDQAGGMQQDSYKYVQLTQANGAIYQVRRKGWFKQNPKVEDGARINVIYEAPEPESEKQSAGEILQKSVATLTSALTIIILAERAFN
ncbi:MULTISPECIES: SLBB domain-containing protein [Gracilimonas]|uniref:SLBB domain-containing protein n=2 Tax=Balneolaceae TaxID=1813606 RepID=UPI0025BE1E3E|nr:SLBB domain-containing protein [Gracilimonas sp.]